MTRWLFSLALATSFLAGPAYAATKQDLKEASSALHDEVKLQHKFLSAEKAWEKGYAKDKSPAMLSAGKKLSAWLEDALAEIPKRVLREARDGEDDSMRAQYAEALIKLRGSLARNGGDGQPKADAAISETLHDIHNGVAKRVAVRQSRYDRIKAELKRK